jgi:hypothetical protein
VKGGTVDPPIVHVGFDFSVGSDVSFVIWESRWIPGAQRVMEKEAVGGMESRSSLCKVTPCPYSRLR